MQWIVLLRILLVVSEGRLTADPVDGPLAMARDEC